MPDVTPFDAMERTAHLIAVDCLLDLIADLLRVDPCSGNNYGACSRQYDKSKPDCPHEKARRMLAKREVS